MLLDLCGNEKEHMTGEKGGYLTIGNLVPFYLQPICINISDAQPSTLYIVILSEKEMDLSSTNLSSHTSDRNARIYSRTL